MTRYEVLSQTHLGAGREADGRLQRPLRILNVALTTPVSHNHYPLPLFSLAGAIERIQPRLHEMTLARSQNESGILHSLETHPVDVLGLSAPQGTLVALDRTLRGIADLPSYRRPAILLGNSLPTYLSDRILKAYPSLPFTVVRGWGENGYADTIKSISTDSLERGQRVVDGSYPEQYPKQAGIPHEGSAFFYYPRVEASKGCFWGACAYCLRPWNENQSKWKQFQPDDIVGQVTDLLKLGHKGYFEFADEEPIGTDIGRFRDIVDRLTVLKKDYPSITFGINMRADHVIAPNSKRQSEYDEFLRQAKRAGLTNVWMGAESYSQSHLKKLRKGSYITPVTNLEAAKKVVDYGIHVMQGFIPYHPLSTWGELHEMVRFMEPHARFLSTVLGSPFGFLRVQYNTPYEIMVRAVEQDTGRSLLGALDENMLSYRCRYLNWGIGLHASYMKIFYDWINPYVKQLTVSALTGDVSSRRRLNAVRSLGLQLFMQSIKELEPLQGDLAALENRQREIIHQYTERIGRLGFPTSAFNESLRNRIGEYKAAFM